MDLPALKLRKQGLTGQGVAHLLPPCQLEQSLPCPLPADSLAHPHLQYLQGLSFFFFFLVQRSWEMLWASAGEGPLCIPAKTIVTELNWLLFHYLH